MPPKDYACDYGVARAVRRRKELFQRVRAARTAAPLFEAVAGLWSAPDYLTKEVSLPFCPSRGRGTFLPSADGKSQSIRKKRIPHKRICAFFRRYTAYPCTEPSPKLTASASSTCRMAFSSSEPIFSRRRRLSSVRICSVRMMESLVSP